MELDKFSDRYIGINEESEKHMLAKLSLESTDQLVSEIIPKDILLKNKIPLEALSEHEYAEEISQMAAKNRVFSSYIGQGWYDTITPSVVFQNIFENPVWHNAPSPIQVETSQGKLEVLINLQTAVSSLTGLSIANSLASDTATAERETVRMLYSLRSEKQKANNANKLFIDTSVFISTISTIEALAHGLNIEVAKGDYQTVKLDESFFGAIIQYPNADGKIIDYSSFASKAHITECKVAVATDLLPLALLCPPGQWGADIAFGSSQRFGIPMFYGGPSVAFIATHSEYESYLPGVRIIHTNDKNGKKAFDLAFNKTEDSEFKEYTKLSQNSIPTLLAAMSAFYVIYHGANGLQKIAKRIHSATALIADELESMGYRIVNNLYFDTLKIGLPPSVNQDTLRDISDFRDINLHYFETGEVGISIDETITDYKAHELIAVFAMAINRMEVFMIDDLPEKMIIKEDFLRKDSILQDQVFKDYNTESELLRYIKRLERKDLSLVNSMIPLGVQSMKLTAASEILPLLYAGFHNIHPYAPESQTQGYFEIITQLRAYIGQITGLDEVCIQACSYADAAYMALMTIRKYHEKANQDQRNIIFIQASANSSNAIAATLARYQVIYIECDKSGSTCIDDLRLKIGLHKGKIAAFMMNYSSSWGTIDEQGNEVCKAIHQEGGLVYMDSNNMNTLIEISNPAIIGADICSVDLQKTFAIPQGIGTSGIYPICVAEHLIPFLPNDFSTSETDKKNISHAPNGNAGILPIAFGYIRMMGSDGLQRASKAAMLNANYIAEALANNYKILYRNEYGRVCHHIVIDCNPIKNSTGITETDIANRLIDYGYHTPSICTKSATLIIEPTESESLAEINRFITAMKEIYKEIKEVETSVYPKNDNVLKNAPHPEYIVCSDNWPYTYSRSKAAYPLPFVEENKYWVNITRLDRGN